MQQSAKCFRSVAAAVMLLAAQPLPLLLLGAAPALAQQAPNPAQRLQDATKKAGEIEAVTGSGRAGDKPVPAADPCAIVPAAETRKVFPAAAAAPERSRRLEQYGITECIWKGANKEVLLVVQESRASSATQARDEARGMAQGLVDPFKRGALENVRIEKFGALDIDNAAFVEAADPARGILSDGAFLALVKGPQVVTLMSPQLAARERGEALKAFESLAAAASRSMK